MSKANCSFTIGRASRWRRGITIAAIPLVLLSTASIGVADDEAETGS